MSTTSSGGLRALCGSLVAITTIICGLRFYARHVQEARLGVDDWMVVPSFLTFIGMVACALYGVDLGIFGHTDREVAAAHIVFGVEASLVISLDVLTAASLGFTRLSALCFYRRLFCLPGHAVALRAAIYTAVVIIILWMAAFIILPLLQCGPDLSVWSAPAAVRAAKCKMGDTIILAFCISDFILELCVIAMPVPRILQLKTTLKRRLLVLLVFITAFVSLGAVTARLAITEEILNDEVRDKSQTNTTQTFMWILEAGFALIAVNMPSLWWLRHKVKPEEVLKSVRSIFSLRSFRSNCSSLVRRRHTSQNAEHDLDVREERRNVPSEERLARLPDIEKRPSNEEEAASENSENISYTRSHKAVGPWATV